MQGVIQGLANVVLTSKSVKAQWRVVMEGAFVWSGPVGLSVVTGRVPAQRFQCVRNSELFRRRVFSCFLIVSWRVSDGFRVRLVPGMCVSICFSWKVAWVVFVCVQILCERNFP